MSVIPPDDWIDDPDLPENKTNDTTNDVRAKFRKRKENKINFELPIHSINFCGITFGGKTYHNTIKELGSGRIISIRKTCNTNIIIDMMVSKVLPANILAYKRGRIEITFVESGEYLSFLLQGIITSQVSSCEETLLIFVGEKILGGRDIVKYYEAKREIAKEELKKQKQKERIGTRKIKRIFNFD